MSENELYSEKSLAQAIFIAAAAAAIADDDGNVDFNEIAASSLAAAGAFIKLRRIRRSASTLPVAPST